MKKSFENRVMHEMIVDTKSYRYMYECDAAKACIKRIAIDALDTTVANSSWEIVKIYE